MKAKSELGGNVEMSAETSDIGPLLDTSGAPIAPIWAAEFRGFFWGEGSLIVRSNRPLAKRFPHVQWKGYSYSISAGVGLRSDDGAVLIEFQRRLGGVLRRETYRDGSGKTIDRWQVSATTDCLRIARVLESPTGLPFNKARQLVLWREAVEIKLSNGSTSGSRYTPEAAERMRVLEETLRDLRKWAG